MTLNRREFVATAGALAAASTMLAACEPRRPAGPEAEPGEPVPAPPATTRWQDVRAAFDLSPNMIHMSAMLISSHPRPVREAIERHRRGLDRDPVAYLEEHNRSRTDAARSAAGDYLGVSSGSIALTDSTTMGVGLVYTGLQLRPGDEVLSTEQDYYVTIEALRLLSERTGARIVQVPLYERTEALGEEEAVARIMAGVTPRTRVVALTWVHSSTGYKLPARAVADAIAELNADRPEDRQILFCLDGVHGFGVEDFRLADLGCDFFMAGCHKWLFGPRGTGIIAAGPRGFAPLVPAIPSFIESRAFDAWFAGDGDPGPATAARMTPGGFKAFEHYWSLPEAFEWQQGIGRAAVAERTHALARQLKEGLHGIPGVTVQTPMSDALSAGIVAFDIEGRSAQAVVDALRRRNIVASAAPYAVPHVRLTPSIRNSTAEINVALQAVRDLA